MKRSIRHLPKNTQEELNTILELIKHYIPWCGMVVLYGSYARKNYVLWDEKIEFGAHTAYQSDYDIMIVISNNSLKSTEDRIRTKITPKYHSAFRHRRHASPQFIIEYADTLNKELERSQYFFTDIVKEGIKIYDTKQYKLAKPRELSFREIKAFAEFEYGAYYQDGSSFLKHGYYDFSDGTYKIGSFQVHQACERFYNAITLVFTNYRLKSHKLPELAAMVKAFNRELSTVFPQTTEFETRCYDLLCRAYIEARYNRNFVVTKEELAYMLARTEVLRAITERICKEQIASYDKRIEQE